MSIYYNPSIVTDGLVLCLDAANRDSYPGTGTAWNDISGSNSSGGTLTNGPVFSSANNGNIFFDGSNDYINFYASDITTIATVEIWCKIGSAYNGKMIFGWAYYDVWCGSSHLGYNTANGDLYGISSSTVSNLGIINNWAHYIFEMTPVSYTNNNIYINTIKQSLSKQLGGNEVQNRGFNNGNGRIACWRNDQNYMMPMNCGSFRVYNRALTPIEIIQNFKAMRNRYGV